MRRPAPETVSQSIALVFTASMCVAILSQRHALVTEATAKPHEIEISLVDEPAKLEPQPPTAPSPMHSPPRRQSATHAEATAAERPLVAEALAPLTAVPASPPESPPAAPRSAASVEAQYEDALRANVDARTELPRTSEYRLLKPHGETKVAFTLGRDGSVAGAVLVRGSGSNILDHQALDIVKSGHYPPIPPAAFAGELHHTFVVTIEFHS